MPLDTSAYDVLVRQHAFMGIARREAFLDWLGEDSWTVNVEQAVFNVKDRGAFPLRLLGTYSLESKTFLWSWANAAVVADKPKAYATTLRDGAMRTLGLAPFTERKLAEAWVPYQEIVAVVSSLAGLPSFEASYGGGIGCILVEGVPPPERVDVRVAQATITLGLAQICVQDAPALTAAFLAQAGFTVTRPSSTSLEARRAGDGLTVNWSVGLDRLPHVWID
jgi:hypothetical protein